MANVQVLLKKVRLHLINKDYIVLFNLQTMTKKKKMFKNEVIPHIWNSQSIEVRGDIFITGGSIANTKNYLKTVYKLNEFTWKLEPLADMHHKRDAHGIIGWKNTKLIVVGSWHVDSSTKTCEIFDIESNKWT